MRRIAYRLRRVALFSLLLVAFAIGAVALALGTAEGRLLVLGTLLEQLSSEIAGEISVGSVSELTPFHVVAEDILVVDEFGREVLAVEVGRLTFDPYALAHDEVHFTRALAVRGRVRISERSDGAYGIDAAFHGTGTGGGPGPTVIFDDIEVEASTVRIAPADAPSVLVSGAHGHLSLRAGGGEATVVHFWETSGHARLLGPLDIRARIRSARGVYDEDARSPFAARIAGFLADEPMEATLTLRRERGDFRLRVDTETHGPLGFLASLGIELASVF
jgi:hypothetical protein